MYVPYKIDAEIDKNTCFIHSFRVLKLTGAHENSVLTVNHTPQVRFLHPLHNFALVSYDPSLLPPEAASKVVAAVLRPTPPIRRGEVVLLAGLTKFTRLMQRKSTVTNATSALTVQQPEVPRFRAVHEEVCVGGVGGEIGENKSGGGGCS